VTAKAKPNNRLIAAPLAAESHKPIPEAPRLEECVAAYCKTGSHVATLPEVQRHRNAGARGLGSRANFN
jgi:hypothetical protein